MVGNVSEFVADWSGVANGADVSGQTIAITRGGDAGDGVAANVNFAFLVTPATANASTGFRCAR
jgi:formylglycine-generating enzyme required for sulfatase activity